MLKTEQIGWYAFDTFFKGQRLDDNDCERINNLIEAATNYVEGIRRSMTCDLPALYDKLDTAVKELQNG